MSLAETDLSVGAVRLVLAALEAPLARLPPAIVRQHLSYVARLAQTGIIKPAGHEPVITASDDFSDSPVSLSWDENRGAYGYFSEVYGWREVSHDCLMSYDIDAARFMAVLMRTSDIAGEPEELLASYLWSLGSVRLSKHQNRVPVLFGRRLLDDEIWRKIEILLRNRPSQEHRILLTSADADRVPIVLRRCTVVSVEDVLESSGVQIDPATLSLRTGQTHALHTNEPVQLFADGRTVIFLGRTFRFPKGDRQREVIRRLYSYYLSDEHPVSSAKLVEDLELGDNTRLKDLFNKSSAWGELLIERHGMCGFCLPGLFDDKK
jgi:hypothetical protein